MITGSVQFMVGFISLTSKAVFLLILCLYFLADISSFCSSIVIVLFYLIFNFFMHLTHCILLE